MFTDKDRDHFRQKGIPEKQIKEQIQRFENGFPYLRVVAPATTGHGISRLSDDMIAESISRYESKKSILDLVKFVPASGAATRMFKKLYEFIRNRDTAGSQTIEKIKEQDPYVWTFLTHLKQFAFYEDMRQAIPGKDPERLIRENAFDELIGCVLEEKGLGYGNMPKGLIKFHKYAHEDRTPCVEHLHESFLYSAGKGGRICIHLTVSPGYLEDFREHTGTLVSAFRDRTKDGIRFEFSVQKPSTDTIAVHMENRPIRDREGNILFRPGGHGALLENLNGIEADLIFIKNIDNVLAERLHPMVARYKQALAGILLGYRNKIFNYVQQLEKLPGDKELIGDIAAFCKNELCMIPVRELDDWDDREKEIYFRRILNRPLRVCGMVKNEDEPGGGPFWVRHGDGSVSLQIVETSQIDTEDTGQYELLKKSTHFNPVDIVCWVKNHRGEKFDLLDFRDDDTGFISCKSSNGKSLKALELPGLWNGSMAYWNTVFVEVPGETFGPVKHINDLLRDEHRT